MPVSIADQLLAAADALCDALRPLSFAAPVTHVYNPLEYARASHEQYVRRFGATKKKVVILGMNPGPWGMAQTGVPFGEIHAVRDWMGISAPVKRPANEHPKRPIVGFDCTQSEVSGRRLWGLFSERYPKTEDFFADHFVANYCPLVFMIASGANFTPDKLPVAEAARIEAACDVHLRAVLAALQPEWLVGVGAFAEAQALKQTKHFPEMKTGRILHPSPASPAANRDWAGVASKQLAALGLW